MAKENRMRSIREPKSNADGSTRPADLGGPDPTANFERLEIEALDASGVGKAVDVTARGMRDNPLHVAAFGDDPELRLRTDGAGLGEKRRHGGEGPGMAGHPYQEVRGDREFVPGGNGLGDCAVGAQRGRVPVPRRCGDGSVAPRGRVPRLLRSRPALGGAAWSSFRGPDGDVYEIIEKEA